jgi:hypothetical protein
MFGSYEFGVTLNIDGIKIETYKEDGFYVYHRRSETQEVRKVISFASRLLVNPSEPVRLPKEVTHYLLIELQEPVFIAPNDELTFYITFPVEFGVYVAGRKNVELLDSFTLTSPKYTLYGTPKDGVICRWWGSYVHRQIPEIDPYLEGIMKVNVKNICDDWVEVKNLVFDAYHMKIYYGDFASMHAAVKVINTKVAETSFIERPIMDGMKKAVELFSLRKLPVMRKAFVMEWGL